MQYHSLLFCLRLSLLLKIRENRDHYAQMGNDRVDSSEILHNLKNLWQHCWHEGPCAGQMLWHECQ